MSSGVSFGGRCSKQTPGVIRLTARPEQIRTREEGEQKAG